MAFRRLHSAPHDSQSNLLRKTTDLLSVGLGLYGHDTYTGSGVHEGEWLILHAITDATVTVIRDAVTETGLVLKAGDRIYGKITSANVTSGTAELYRSPQ